MASTTIQEAITSSTYRIVQVKDLHDHKLVKAEHVWLETYKNGRINNSQKDSFLTIWLLDPLANAMVGGRADLLSLNYRACARAAVVGGQFWVALTESDEVVGTAIWYPPGTDFLSDEKQKKEGASELLATIKAEEPKVHEWLMSSLVPALDNSTDRFMGQGFRAKSWKIYSLTFRQTYKGKGIVKMLLKPGEDQAAAQGVSTCIEEENKDLLEEFLRLGYKEVGQTVILGPPDKIVTKFSYHNLVKHHNRE
ncbi:hypothetical protein AN958_11563 [Leucoagaricus sp. SymC.cos]|nr:hypothetical protein AN958_11563 [Leucoagaricus sp. SymC.cos]